MSEGELQRKLDTWSGDQTAEYGVLLNDLAQFKLNKVLHRFWSKYTPGSP